VALLLVSACEASRPSVPTAPSTPQEPSPSRFSGQVVATVTGEPLASVAVALGSLTTLTSDSGQFAFDWPGETATTRVGLSSPEIVPRSIVVSVAVSRALTIDAIVQGRGFDLAYYRRLARRGLEQPGTLLPLRRWTRAPRVYLKTVDEAGRPIDAETLRLTESALIDEAPAWTGGRFGLADVVRGTGTQEGSRDWVTVKWPNPAIEGNVCGQAQVALEGGWIELNYLNANCACDGSRIGPGIVRHELGHTMGFYHTDEPGDLLATSIGRVMACSGRPSPRERLHAAVAYSRPVGNLDPDSDPGSTIHSRQLPPIVIVD
jgi:hypothetical protein